MPKPIIGITMGDPAGIGPEIIAKALQRPRIYTACRPVVFGSLQLLRRFAAPDQNCVRVQSPSEAPSEKWKIPVVDVRTSGNIRPGHPSAASGRTAIDCLDRAIACAIDNQIDAIVTAPIGKAAVQMAGIRNFTGHTEYLARKTKTASFAMMFYSRRLMVGLVTTHLPLRLVPKSITRKRILEVVTLSWQAAQKLGRPNPRIGVAGINPHAGEQGALGSEDQRIVAPAVRDARRRNIRAEGPLPADVLFRLAYEGEFDVAIAMYHDQALAPFKMVAFDEGVNVTIGLPFVRTSVAHGTAFDIAGKGIASDKSMVQAILLAARLA